MKDKSPKDESLIRKLREARKRIKELEKSEVSIHRKNEQLRKLASRLAEVETMERRRLSRELHDQVGQQLTALGINLSILERKISKDAPPIVHSKIVDSMALVKEMMDIIRNIMTELRPSVLDNLGLTASLQWYGELFTSRTGISVLVNAAELPHVPAFIENTLFRILQESLTNVVKHSGARKVRVSLDFKNEALRLTIQDNGVGLDPNLASANGKSKGWGLTTMRERLEIIGGHLLIGSNPGQGTRVVAEVPL
jgi:signal transduction histidine kinase